MTDNKSQQNITINDIKAIVSKTDSLSNKITPEHITQMIDYQHKENNSKYSVITISIIAIFVFLGFIMYTFKYNESLLKDILDKIIYLFLGIIGGVGVDRFFLKK